MHRTAPTVTIGIPAFNEAANIGHLLNDILTQYEVSFVLEKIIIVSDGSTDATEMITRSFSDKRIELISDGERLGSATRQNQIIRAATSDILVLLNADIVLEGKYFLRSLIAPMLSGQADFASGDMLAVEPQTFVGKVLVASTYFKNAVFEEWRGGENIYTCHGVARAFTRTYLENFQFPESVGEDAYSYLWGKVRGFRYAYAPYAVSRIKLPETLQDHFRQSVRFVRSKERFMEEFGEEYLKKEYALPLMLTLKCAVCAFVRQPFLFAVYGFVYLWSQIQAAFSREILSQTWEIATSSKNVRG